MLIPLDRLVAHPANANRMSETMLAKLADHIERSGQYPAVIVRPLPRASPGDGHDGDDDQGAAGEGAGATDAQYQILDGHHRVLALRRLGRTDAECDVWREVDDDRAAVLLLTLNRLRGEDDPQRRGELLRRLAARTDIERLQRSLPDDLERIRKLIALSRVPDEAERRASAEAAALVARSGGLPQGLTIFLSVSERAAAIARLGEIDVDRRRALLIALGIEPGRGGDGSADRGAPQHATQ